MKSGTELIAAERTRQITKEGWTRSHDDQHASGEMNDAAISYAMAAAKQARGNGGAEYLKSLQSAAMVPWPWEAEWWKPDDDPIRNLVKAGALIAAEIDRLQRLPEPMATPKWADGPPDYRCAGW